MEKEKLSKEGMEILKVSNKIRTKLLIYSNIETQNYLKENTILFNSISPQAIARKYDNLGIKFDNPTINFKANLEYDSLNKNQTEDENKFKININKVLSEKSIGFAEVLESKKILCSKRKLQRNSEFLSEKILFGDDILNYQNNQKSKAALNTSSELIKNKSLANENNFWEKARNYDSKFSKKNFNSNNSNSMIYSKTIIVSNLSNMENVLKSKNIQKSFEKMQRLAFSLKIIENKDNNLKFHKENYEELLDILEYKGLCSEKKILNENIDRLISLRLKKEIEFQRVEDEKKNINNNNNQDTNNRVLCFKNTPNYSSKFPPFNDEFNILKKDLDIKNIYENNQLLIFEDIEIEKDSVIENDIKKENYNTFINKNSNEKLRNNKIMKSTSPKKNKIYKPPRIHNFSNSGKNISLNNLKTNEEIKEYDEFLAKDELNIEELGVNPILESYEDNNKNEQIFNYQENANRFTYEFIDEDETNNKFNKISKFQKHFKNIYNKSSALNPKKEFKKANNKNKIVNLNCNYDNTSDNLNFTNTNIGSINNQINTNNLNSNNTLSGNLYTNFRNYDYSNMTSNSLLTNNITEFNSNVYTDNKSNNTSNNGFSSVSFYDENLEYGLENYHNSNLVTNSNYISGKNYEQNLFNSNYGYDSNFNKMIDSQKNYSTLNLNSQYINTNMKSNNNLHSINYSDYVSDNTKNSNLSNGFKSNSFITKSSGSDIEI